ncbi:MAG TPA: helical backbone metal receptor [Burkholderiaceae bacterium]
MKIAALALWFAAACASAAPQPGPQRIVSMLPSLTETVCALGACSRLVGVDRYSNYPAEVQRLPRLGDLDQVQLETLATLKPDLVLVSTSARVQERLTALGFKVVALDSDSVADVKRAIQVIGQLLEVPEPMRLWQRIEAGIAAAAASMPPAARGLLVYYEIDPTPYAAGAASFVGATLARLGARNIAGPELGPFPRLNPEFVVRADPQVIMLGDRSAAGLASRPGWNGIRALRAGHVCSFKPEESDALARPGPRMDEAARLMARCLSKAVAK